eukprot:8434241-Pyramimonas_sp.AAC.1
MRNSLGPLLAVAAAAGERDPFWSPKEGQARADAAKAGFSSGAAALSDHLALASAFDQWRRAEQEGRGAAFAQVGRNSSEKEIYPARARRGWSVSCPTPGSWGPWGDTRGYKSGG